MGYTAFISYSWDDRRVARALQSALEKYTIPIGLRGNATRTGRVGKRLGHVFLDRTDLRASTGLGQNIVEALSMSRHLIVVCSPRAAVKDWVLREIEMFRKIEVARPTQETGIIAVIADGVPQPFDPVTAPDGAFPAPLVEEMGGDIPLAPDFRDVVGTDGFEIPLLQVVARLLDVPLADLTERHLMQERARQRVRARVIASLTGLLALTVAGGWTAWTQKQAADQRFEQALSSASRQVEQATQFEDRYGVPSSVLRDLFIGAEEDFAVLAKDAGREPQLIWQRLRYYRNLAALAGSVEGSVIASTDHLDAAERDLAALEALVAGRLAWAYREVLPNAAELQLERIQLLNARARIALASGDGTEAQRIARQALSLSQEAGQAAAHCGLGDVLYATGLVAQARVQFEECSTKAEAAAAQAPTVEALRQQVKGLLRLGNILRADPDEHEASYNALAKAVQVADSVGSDLSRDDRVTRAQAQAALADTLDQMGAPEPETLGAYQSALADLAEVIQSDLNRRDLRTFRAQLLYRSSGVRLRCAFQGRCSWDAARESLTEAQEAVDIQNGLLTTRAEDEELRWYMTAYLAHLGVTAANLHDRVKVVERARLAEIATTAIDRALDVLPQGEDVRVDRRQAELWVASVQIQLLLGRNAADQLRSARKALTDLVEIPEAEVGALRDLSLLDYLEARSLMAQGQTATACEAARASVERLVPLAKRNERLEGDLTDAKRLQDQACKFISQGSEP